MLGRLLLLSGAQVYLSHSTWDLSSQIRDRTLVLCIGKQILHHWTTREVPGQNFRFTEKLSRKYKEFPYASSSFSLLLTTQFPIFLLLTFCFTVVLVTTDESVLIH